ncbi:MAG: DUF1343 domain-containing protein [Gemmatimonadetes bacterium]|nr:DUF1343 domain-containing protein [Gemmatimonadota bacterium]
MQLRSVMWLVVVVGCTGPARTHTGRARPGIDVLLSDSVHLVAGRRVGLLTNQTGVDADGVDDVFRLMAAGVPLTLFNPEHGRRGVLDQENIEHGVDSATRIIVYSLYGTVREPTAEMLANVDVMVVDLQDIGARTFTFVSTALRTLRAATAHGVPVVVLDRPNPVGGELVQGPVLDMAFASFVGMLPVPLRHGMTFGELMRFGNDVLGIHGDLAVIPVTGWPRSAWFDQTGLPWVRPSPNMPSLESATHYPGIVLFEATNLSVGRGTPIAFQVIGAPWLDAGAVARALGPQPHVSVRDTVITPVEPPDGKYGARTIPAIRLLVTDRHTYDPVALAVRLLYTVRQIHPGSIVIRARDFDRRAGSDGLRLALEAGVRPDSIIRSWDSGLMAFRTLRRRYLLY